MELTLGGTAPRLAVAEDPQAFADGQPVNAAPLLPVALEPDLRRTMNGSIDFVAGAWFFQTLVKPQDLSAGLADGALVIGTPA
jgi:hypothetical protein